MLRSEICVLLVALGLITLGAIDVAHALTTPPSSPVRARIVNPNALKKRGLGPHVKITSPLDGAFIAPGDSRIGDGDPNGTGFAIVAQIVTRDDNNVSVDEDINIRHVDALFGR